MRVSLVTKRWAWNPSLYADGKYRRACSYEWLVPDTPRSESALPATVLGVVSDAEQAIIRLNSPAHP